MKRATILGLALFVFTLLCLRYGTSEHAYAQTAFTSPLQPYTATVNVNGGLNQVTFFSTGPFQVTFKRWDNTALVLIFDFHFPFSVGPMSVDNYRWFHLESHYLEQDYPLYIIDNMTFWHNLGNGMFERDTIYPVYLPFVEKDYWGCVGRCYP